jgi:AraC-like DNA-binding protein
MTNLIRAAAFKGFIDLARELGGDPIDLLQKVNIKQEELSNPDQLVSATAFVSALQMAAESTGHVDFGLRLGERQDIDMLGPTGILARQSNTIEEAFVVISRYVNLHNPGATIEIQTYNDKALLVYDDITLGFPRNPQICDLALAIGTSAIRQFADAEWNPKAVFFVHKEPDDTSIYKRIFNAPMYFDQQLYAVEFDRSTLEIYHAEADPELKRFFTRYVKQLEAEYASDTQSVVGQLIRSLLNSGRCTEEHIADIMQINRRTIQRRLKAENTSFKALLAGIRLKLAQQYLRDTNLSLADISTELGYSEPSAFMRFFKQQTGLTPMGYRRS